MKRSVCLCGVVTAALAVATLASAVARHHAVAGPHREDRATVARTAAPTSARAVARPASAARPGRSTAAVTRPGADPCAHNRRAKLVVVSLAAQRTWLCARSSVWATFAVTTGRRAAGDGTPRGTFAVQARTRDTDLDPAGAGVVHVAYWIPYKLGMYGFHDAPWQTIPFGSPRYVTSGSRGCVHMRRSDVARLFGWVVLGTVVSVRSR